VISPSNLAIASAMGAISVTFSEALRIGISAVRCRIFMSGVNSSFVDRRSIMVVVRG